MNILYFISARISRQNKNTFSRTILIIATWGIALGLSVMIIATSILFGFQNKIKDKIFTFASHLTIKKFSNNESYEEPPFSMKELKTQKIFSNNAIKNIQPYLYKTSLMKTEEGVSGVIVKGVDNHFDKKSWKEYIVKGTIPDFGDTSSLRKTLISKKIAEKLKLTTGEEFLLFFAQNPPKFRKMKVTGIFESGMEEFDDFMILGSRRLLNDINGITSDQIGGLEIRLNKTSMIPKMYEEISAGLPYQLQLFTVYDYYGHLFDWLNLLDRNVIIIIVLVLLVSGINLISALLVLVIEKSKTIGILKSLGATDRQILKILLYLGMRIIVKGLFWGNGIGIGIAFVQKYFRIIPLQPENYYMKYVPIELNTQVLFLLNIFTLLVTLIFLIIPGTIASKTKPVQVLKWN